MSKSSTESSRRSEREAMTDIAVGPVADRMGVTSVLYAHAYGLFDDEDNEYGCDYKGDGVRWRCHCGWQHPEVVNDSCEFDHSYHVAGVLKETFDVQPRHYE